MKTKICVVSSVLFLAVTLFFLVTVTIPWMDDPNGGLNSPGLTILGILAHIVVPAYFLGRAMTHEEPYKYTNDFKISLRNRDAEKYWKHRL